MFYNKSNFVGFLCLFLLLVTIPFSSALASRPLYTTFTDGESNPITTALDIRISLWDAYDTRSEDVDGNGDINTSAIHYGGYLTTLTVTPNVRGNYEFDIEALPSFPSPIGTNDAFLNLEYKAQGDPNTNYQNYDFVNDPPWQNLTRYLLVDNVTYFTYDAGPRTNNNAFTLDANSNATTEVKLEFGETLAEYLQWSITNTRFELSDNLYLDGSLELTGGIDFNLSEIKEVRVENLASAPTCDGNAKGRLYYNTGDNLIYFCNGTNWTQI